MGVGKLPYKAKVTSVTPNTAGAALIITVTDADGNVRRQQGYTLTGSHTDTTAVRQLLTVMKDLVMAQVLADAGGDPVIALQSFCVSYGA